MQWLQGPDWSWAKLTSDGLWTAKVNQETIRGRYAIIASSLRLIIAQQPTEVLVIVPVRKGVAKCSRFNFASGELLDEGSIHMDIPAVARGR